MSEDDKNALMQRNPFEVRSVTQVIPFPPGTYRLSVRSASPEPDPKFANIPFPALLVAIAPGVPQGSTEFNGNPSLNSVWLFRTGEVSIVKVGGGGTALTFTSLRSEGSQLLDIKVDKLGAEKSAATGAAAPVPHSGSLKLQIDLHLRGEGDVPFVDTEWAGRPGAGSWIESLAIAPLEVLTASDLEYKGLSANGFETPWLSDGAVCGTKGASTPLVGFAVRLKPHAAAEYDIEYGARFRSGVTIGPLRNGAPCRSKTVGDPLEAIQLAIVKRVKAAAAPAVTAAPAPVVAAAKPSVPSKGPRFSKLREDDDATPVEPIAKPAAKAGGAPKSSGPAKAATPAKPGKAAAVVAKAAQKPVAKTPTKQAASAAKRKPKAVAPAVAKAPAKKLVAKKGKAKSTATKAPVKKTAKPAGKR